MYVCVSVDRWTASWMCATLMYKLGLWLACRLCTRVRVMLSKNLLIYFTYIPTLFIFTYLLPNRKY